ncbi:DUF302 domain-containing protein [Paraburkholderia atlantica]|uniref:Uncharacterized protein n=1 Tax=Paraburkholderia atlantica TaxID=2654982 RepID=D5WDP1_PARAM|nr:DUF302 domain-containing protein [Paraburkholderia atlantica]ADG18844.1 protein of unknown function DUF302 [Paraburkholderia atlantica]MBB5505086.1 uncharacterized protein (DUF302 family) [Paraburkholderia atlantica]
MRPTITTIGTEHVDLLSSKDFDETVKDLTAELGKVSTEKLMDRLYSSRTWDDYANECREIAGRSSLIEVGYLNWGGVLSLSGTPMKAACFIVGNPLTAQKLLSAGGAQVGLYLPTKMLVFEDAEGATHVSYDKFLPIMATFGDAALNQVAGAIDVVLDKLATVAVN